MNTNTEDWIWSIAGNGLGDNQNLKIRVYSWLEKQQAQRVGGSLPLPFGLNRHGRECLVDVEQNRG